MIATDDDFIDFSPAGLLILVVALGKCNKFIYSWKKFYTVVVPLAVSFFVLTPMDIIILNKVKLMWISVCSKVDHPDLCADFGNEIQMGDWILNCSDFMSSAQTAIG